MTQRSPIRRGKKRTSKGPADRPKRILLIDDHALSRTALSYALVHHGYACKAVGTAKAAVDAIAVFEPHIVLLEWHLRDGAGRGLAALLRERSLLHKRPLFVVAASTQNEPAEFRQQEDVDAYLTKPFGPKDVELLLREHEVG